jgi:hypothetical protein
VVRLGCGAAANSQDPASAAEHVSIERRETGKVCADILMVAPFEGTRDGFPSIAVLERRDNNPGATGPGISSGDSSMGRRTLSGVAACLLVQLASISTGSDQEPEPRMVHYSDIPARVQIIGKLGQPLGQLVTVRARRTAPDPSKPALADTWGLAMRFRRSWDDHRCNDPLVAS